MGRPMIATSLRAALLASLLPAALVACTSTAPTTTPDEGTPSATVTAEATSTPTSEASAVVTAAPTVVASASPDAPRSYALVVSFFSPGNGTDNAASDKLTAIVAKLPKKVAQVTGRWGKEGEHDECFDLGELDAKEKAAFIAQVKQDVGSSKRVNINENATCQSR